MGRCRFSLYGLIFEASRIIFFICGLTWVVVKLTTKKRKK